MTSSLKFPPTFEIKRAIAAAMRAGIQIESIDIRPQGITIHVRDRRDENAEGVTAYDLWKISQGADTSRVRHSAQKTDAPQKNNEKSVG